MNIRSQSHTVTTLFIGFGLGQHLTLAAALAADLADAHIADLADALIAALADALIAALAASSVADAGFFLSCARYGDRRRISGIFRDASRT